MKGTLYQWMRENNLSIKDMCEKIGCHRQTLRFANEQKAIDDKHALAIKILTLGKVDAIIKNRGRPKKVINRPTT